MQLARKSGEAYGNPYRMGRLADLRFPVESPSARDALANLEQLREYLKSITADIRALDAVEEYLSAQALFEVLITDLSRAIDEAVSSYERRLR